MLKCTCTVIFRSHLVCLKQRGKFSEILASAIGSLLVFAQQVLRYLGGKPCKEQLMDFAHCSKHQLWSCEGSGCGVHAAVAVTRLAVAASFPSCATVCRQVNPAKQSNRTARAAQYICGVQTA